MEDLEEYLEPFIEVSENVFETLGGVKITAGRPYIVSRDTVHEWDISAIIGLAGEARGAVVISFKQNTALQLATQMSGKTFIDWDDMVIDIIGEIINIIAGKAKQRLEEKFRLVISLPSIIRGKEHAIWWPGDAPRIICIPFKIFGNDSFTLSVTLEPSI
ncbi:chemotaxis protein CheX [Spirochaetia bacterium]|nr:chemotaxis protein CheX [Spirochaetia bacterium]